MKEKVLVAMSGGVDSSVTALLLKQQGYECIGVTMRLFENEDAGVPREKSCCSLEDVEDARSVACRIGIPYYVFNFTQEFRTEVMTRFVDGYWAGETPNPCIDCNRCIKWKKLFSRARELGCRYVATGHYACIEQDEDGLFRLKKGPDAHKDQSYVLYSLTQEQLAHTLFPLGGMRKEEVRRIAQENGLMNAKKRDSQDICFVPDGDYAGFVERFSGRRCPAGALVSPQGKVLGTQNGYIRYTLGQRRGLRVAAGERLYVCAKHPAENTVVLGTEKDLLCTELLLRDVNWIAGAPPAPNFAAMVRTGYHGTESRANICVQANGTVRAVYETPVRAAAPGQAAVMYEGDTLLGGGTVDVRPAGKNVSKRVPV